MSIVKASPTMQYIDVPIVSKSIYEPQIVFFSGGTAVSPLASCLKKYTKNTIHIITPFDSGGSSAVLRKIFSMPAVGDLRARLIALIDDTQPDYMIKVCLFNYRLPEEACAEALFSELTEFAYGTHRIISQLSAPFLKVIKDNVQYFLKQVPKDTDLSGASIGNILLTAKYLQEDRDLVAAVSFFSQWLGIHGVVHPLVDVYAHLCVELQNGEKCIGQHCFTGKDVEPIKSPIQSIWFTDTLESTDSINLKAYDETSQYIKKADLICFPMGSFFSSIVANLLPEGIAEAISQTTCPKVFIPNKARDPELFGYSVQDQIEYLAYVLGCRVDQQIYPDIIILDEDIEAYSGGDSLLSWLYQKGIQVIQSNLVVDDQHSYFEPKTLSKLLLSLL